MLASFWAWRVFVPAFLRSFHSHERYGHSIDGRSIAALGVNFETLPVFHGGRMSTCRGIYDSQLAFEGLEGEGST